MNSLLFDYSVSYFFSSSIYEINYSFFAILPLFMVYSHYFIASKNTTADIKLMVIWCVVGLFSIIFSFVASIIPMSFRLLGGFCIAMGLITYGFKVLKDSNAIILPFLAPIMIISLWIAIIIPYTIVIPTFSIFIDQSFFGNFIYICILGTVLLLIILVGVISMIFNSLMNKF
jgi:hypothetical protein